MGIHPSLPVLFQFMTLINRYPFSCAVGPGLVHPLAAVSRTSSKSSFFILHYLVISRIYRILSRPVASYRILSHPVASCRVLSRPVASCRVLSRPHTVLAETRWSSHGPQRSVAIRVWSSKIRGGPLLNALFAFSSVSYAFSRALKCSHRLLRTRTGIPG